MRSVAVSILLYLLLVMMPIASRAEWCIAKDETPDDALQHGLDWVCGPGGADCSLIQQNQTCFLPDTVKDHASFAFNDYWQNFKHQGGTCFFNDSATITDEDPSHDECQFESLA